MNNNNGMTFAEIQTLIRSCKDIAQMSAETDVTKEFILWYCMNVFSSRLRAVSVDLTFRIRMKENNNTMYFRIYNNGKYIMGTEEDYNEWMD